MFLNFSKLKGFKDEQKQIFICIPALMTQQVNTLAHKLAEVHLCVFSWLILLQYQQHK